MQDTAQYGKLRVRTAGLEQAASDQEDAVWSTVRPIRIDSGSTPGVMDPTHGNQAKVQTTSVQPVTPGVDPESIRIGRTVDHTGKTSARKGWAVP
ncbi:hypothetical protein B0A49_13947, partial [Cryomyces minteri]